jgi:hypothetical protein
MFVGKEAKTRFALQQGNIGIVFEGHGLQSDPLFQHMSNDLFRFFSKHGANRIDNPSARSAARGCMGKDGSLQGLDRTQGLLDIPL